MRELHDGRQDGLVPLTSLDVRAATDVADLLRRMGHTSFGGRELGQAFEVLSAMADDPDCTIVVTVSGAMTVAKMGRVLCEMIELGLAHLVISTGAIMAHGLSEAVGGVHYKHDPAIPDRQLYDWGYNRVYDTVEMEANLHRGQDMITEVIHQWDASKPMCSSALNREIGKRLFEQGQMPSVLGCAYRREVPVYVPAFTDSDLGLSVSKEILARGYTPGSGLDLDAFFSAVPSYNPFLDLHDYTRRVLKAKRLGIFTIGGGVPRNWRSRSARSSIFSTCERARPYPPCGSNTPSGFAPSRSTGAASAAAPTPRASPGVSSSPADEGGRFAEVHCDATIAWPLLVRAMIEIKRARNPELEIED